MAENTVAEMKKVHPSSSPQSATTEQDAPLCAIIRQPRRLTFSTQEMVDRKTRLHEEIGLFKHDVRLNRAALDADLKRLHVRLDSLQYAVQDSRGSAQAAQDANQSPPSVTSAEAALA